MPKSKILEKLKTNRTRPAEIEGEPVNVKVYSANQIIELNKKIDGFKGDQEFAAFMADQFTDEKGELVFTPEFLLSDDVPNVAYRELSELFWQVNHGIYKKKQ